MTNKLSFTLLFLSALICIPKFADTRAKFDPISGDQNRILSSLGSKDAYICHSLVESRGYVCERHEVTTNDNYILSIQRIPIGRSGRKADKPPVLLQHGIFSNAGTWISESPEESLAFILADSGFDVWLANTRGTTPSRRHTSLSPSDPDYWDWTWDELAAYDLPAFVQYVHRRTRQRLHYVGHSLGTLIAFAAFSQDNLRNMMRSAALLCPIAYLSLIPSPLTQAAARLFLAEDLYWLGLHQFVPEGKEFLQLLDKICNLPGIDCTNLLSSFTGPNCCVNDSNVNISGEPTATKNIIHLAQMIRTGTIQMYDYGEKNMNHYGQTFPPKYNITRIPNDLPLYLSYGGRDKMSDVKDVQNLLRNLSDHDDDKLVVQFIEDYAHLDFVRGVTANKVVYDPLIAFFRLH